MSNIQRPLPPAKLQLFFCKDCYTQIRVSGNGGMYILCLDHSPQEEGWRGAAWSLVLLLFAKSCASPEEEVFPWTGLSESAALRGKLEHLGTQWSLPQDLLFQNPLLRALLSLLWAELFTWGCNCHQQRALYTLPAGSLSFLWTPKWEFQTCIYQLLLLCSNSAKEGSKPVRLWRLPWQRGVFFIDLCRGHHQPWTEGSCLRPFNLSSDIVSSIILPVSCLCLLFLARLSGERVNWHFESFSRVSSLETCDLGSFWVRSCLNLGYDLHNCTWFPPLLS